MIYITTIANGAIIPYILKTSLLLFLLTRKPHNGKTKNKLYLTICKIVTKKIVHGLDVCITTSFFWTNQSINKNKKGIGKHNRKPYKKA